MTRGRRRRAVMQRRHCVAAALATLLVLVTGCGSRAAAATAAPGADDAVAEAAARAGADAASGAVVLVYHHVSADTPPSTSVTPQTFEAHLDHLQRAGHTVVPLSRIVRHVTDGAPLPPRAVALTFDDAYASVYREAAPRLARRGLPYTVFVSTDYVDQGLGSYMSWAQLRELEQAGASIGNHSRSHGHYVFRRPQESEAEWRRRISADIEAAQTRLQAELARPLPVLAWPYGESDPALRRLAEQLGLVAFGQQSGPVGRHSDPRNLPRFPMASPYAELPELAQKLRTRPFRLRRVEPADPVLPPEGPPPTLTLDIASDAARLDALRCFVGGQPPPRVVHHPDAPGVVAVTAAAPLPAGRTRYTCTAPARDADGVYYWYSHLWMKPPAAGAWYDD